MKDLSAVDLDDGKEDILKDTVPHFALLINRFLSWNVAVLLLKVHHVVKSKKSALHQKLLKICIRLCSKTVTWDTRDYKYLQRTKSNDCIEWRVDHEETVSGGCRDCSLLIKNCRYLFLVYVCFFFQMNITGFMHRIITTCENNTICFWQNNTLNNAGTIVFLLWWK